MQTSILVALVVTFLSMQLIIKDLKRDRFGEMVDNYPEYKKLVYEHQEIEKSIIARQEKDNAK